MSNAVRFSAVALSLTLMVLSLAGCGDTVIATEGLTSSAEKVVTADISQSVNIGYYEEDSFNPFFMKNDLNTDLISLVFEPLFDIDDSFYPVENLALSYETEGVTLTVTLDTSAAFSDGVQISSSDVVYSFNLAKTSSLYKSELSNVSSAAASAADKVVFTFTAARENAAAALNFPIVKNATADSDTDIPVGTGLYGYSVSGDDKTLEYNVYCRSPEPSVKTVNLVSIPASSTLIHTLELGTIDAYFDDLSSGSNSLSNSSNTKTNLPNLVFIGINSSSYGLSSAAVRQALFCSVNRTSIVKNSFKNYAVESYTPYHPQWYVFTESGYDTSGFGLDYSSAGELMTAAGFTEELNYTLIVYAGNNFKVAAAEEIADCFENIGINLTISELTWSEYQTALINGDYDLYLGEIKVGAAMDLSALFGGSSVLYGVSSSDTTGTAYTEYANGNISLTAFTDSFMQNMPIIPLCFRMGTLVYSDRISPAADCDYLNVYKNIYEWSVSG
ncbi:MAG: ABC transporter substrate-binding protein [Clostridiales bacterium]|nr:ABC transporter substrate-binding protein [Clostridiales bacterium]